MMELEQAVLENLMLAGPSWRSSPLVRTSEGVGAFTRWCEASPAAQHLVESALADAPVFGLDDEDSIFILSMDYAEAGLLLQCLVSAYEDEQLAQLIQR